ncbi:MAG: S8 family serine peptidase [Actinomycetota bacterium]|nr:S8 family serine peptidase [Actinomycetota bacterium]
MRAGSIRVFTCLVICAFLLSFPAIFAHGGGEEDAAPAGRRAEIGKLRRKLAGVALEEAGAVEKEPLVAGGAPGEAACVPGEVILGIEGEASALPDLLAGTGGILEEVIPRFELARVTFPPDIPVREMLDRLGDMAGIRWAEPNYLRSFSVVPDDTRVPDQWHLDDIGAFDAWDTTTGSSGVTVAVLDSGIYAAHEDMDAGRILPGRNLVAGGSDVSDSVGHGTMVASVLGAATDNAIGIAGTDWECSILPVVVGDAEGVSVWDGVEGIQYAADQGADVINMSFGGGQYAQAEREAVDYAREKGCVLVASSGNGGEDLLEYPASYHNVIGVGAGDKSSSRCSFSNYGTFLDVLAPGVDIVVPAITAADSYDVIEGTSFSAPMVSGLAALIKAHCPDAAPGEVEWRVEDGAQGSGKWDRHEGFGVIDIDDSLGLPGSSYVDSMEPNDTAGQARAVDTGFYESNISHNSDIDVYRIDPDLSGYTNIALFDVPADCDYDIWLYEGEINLEQESGSLVAASLNSGDMPEIIKCPVKKGRIYYLVVDTAYGFSDQAYQLLVLNPFISTSWFFAEGTTRHAFDEWLCVQNPGDAAASVQCLYMFEDGQDAGVYSVPPHSRYTIKVNEEVGEDKDVSVALLSDQPVVTERPMYFDYKDSWAGGHDVVGARMPFYYWYFAEGYTGDGFEEWLCLQNPNEHEIEAEVTFMFEGGGTQVKYCGLDPLSRFTLSVNHEVGPGRDVSIMVMSDDELVAERPMYFDYKGAVKGGHNVVGTNLPSQAWFFAEGCTRRGFEEWLCLQNPYADNAAVEIYYLTSQGPAFYEEVSLPAFSRETVFVNESLGPDQDVSVVIISDVPIVAERPMYFLYSGAYDGGHDSLGCDTPSYGWYFAEGCTRPGLDTWLCMQNPWDEEVEVTVDYMLGTGETVRCVHNLDPMSRSTVLVSEEVGIDRDVAIRLEAEQPIVAERPMYFNYGGAWRGGHDAMGYVPGG